MADADRERWDVRHAAADSGYAAPGPVPPDALRGRESLLPAGGRALEVGCGRGAVAVWLAVRGATVDAVDVSPVGLAAGERLAARHGATDRVRWWCHDLDAGLPDRCAGPYDVVVCQRYRDPAGYPALAGRLAPCGLLVVTVLSEVGSGPGPFRAHEGELRRAFAALDVLHHSERDGEASILARSGRRVAGTESGTSASFDPRGRATRSGPAR